jgi:two-component system NtrC family sensor kinase
MRKASAPHTRKADLAAENARLQEEVRALRAQRDKAVSARDATAELLGVISKENEHLIAETREALEKQIATAEILHIISNSPADLQPTLDAIAARATALSGAAIGVVYRFDGSLIHLGTPAGLTAGEIDALRSVFPLPPSRGTATARAILTREIVHIADPTADQEYPQERFNQFGTVLSVPMLRGDTPLGAITVSRRHIAEFSEVQIALVQTFADQAVIAIENTRLFGELQRRTADLTRSVAELQALEEVLRAVNSSLDLDTVLATIIGRAAQLSQADEGTIYEFDETEEVFVPKSAFGMSVERVAALRDRKIRMGETHLGRSALLRAPVYVQDVQQDPSAPHAARTLPGIHAVLAVPLLSGDKVVGGLVIRRRTEAGFAPTIPTLLQTFAGQAVLAIENARLFQELGTRGEEARRARTAAEAALADLRRAQDRLIQAEKMASLGQLTAGIAHEIKNPLNFVNNFADLSVELLDELKETAAPAIAALGDEKRAEVDEVIEMLSSNLEKIAEHGRRADGIVKSMLEHSRSESGERREVDLNGLVEEALNLAYHGARAQDQKFNIALERNLDPTIAPIELVPQDIARVCLNLFGNGFYAANKRQREGAEPAFRPALKVATRDLGEVVEIRVRDNGIGIPDEIKDKLFQPFFTTKPTGEGTGLGLSISWDIVTQQHGGTIEVDSRVGEFTEFAIRLPRAREATTATTTEAVA